MSRVAVITGASPGIGEATALFSGSEQRFGRPRDGGAFLVVGPLR